MGIFGPVGTRKQRPSLWRACRGATTLEWALLLAVIALPAYYIIQVLLATLIGHYRMMTMINSLPVP